jgi:hypothetical protein
LEPVDITGVGYENMKNEDKSDDEVRSLNDHTNYEDNNVKVDEEDVINQGEITGVDEEDVIDQDEITEVENNKYNMDKSTDKFRNHT